MDCLQLPFIRVEEAVSWTHSFLTKIEVYLWQINVKAKVCGNSTFRVNRKKNATGRRRLTSSNRAAIFVSTSCQERHHKLGDSTKNNKALLFFQVRKQFKLLTVPFKPLRYCFRSDKLVNCHVWRFCKDLFLKLRVIWSVNQFALFNAFLSDFVEITSCVYTKPIILFNLGE